jgi:uncharacterized membrane protein
MPRMIIALSSLISALVATYLHLWKLGKVGALACTGNHGCEIAQFSAYGSFFGVDVALIGAIGYTIIFAVAVLGLVGNLASDRRVTSALTALVTFGVLFTVRLKYGEWYVLGTFCPWCFVNVVTMTTNAIMVRADWKRLRDETQDDSAVVAVTA